jgi:Flp pilus assembly secretin CpaC
VEVRIATDGAARGDDGLARRVQRPQPAEGRQTPQEALARKRSSEAVENSVDKEKAPVGTRARRLGGSHALKNGESIWIQAGKSRVLNVPYNVQRVSIGNPDLAGVVVLGPRSILINAKELPKQDSVGGGGGSRTSRSGILSLGRSPPRTSPRPR